MSSQGYYAAMQAPTPGYIPMPWAPFPPSPERPAGGGPYQVGAWGRPMVPLSSVKTYGGYMPLQSLPQPVVILPPAPPLLDFVQLQPRGKSPKGR